MVGYKILEVDREKIARHPILKDLSKQLFCPICSFLVREPIGVASCPHRFCSSCLLERNSSQVVCPVDKREFPVQETYPDKYVEEAVKDINICCTFDSKTGEPCGWVGQIRHLEVHMDSHHKGAREATAKQAQYQAENCAQLSSTVSPSTTQGAVPGPPSLPLFDEPGGEESWMKVPPILMHKQAQYQAENRAQLSSAVSPSTTQGAGPGPPSLPLFDEPDGEGSWKEVAKSLMHKQRTQDKDIEDLKQQVKVLLEAYTTEKRYCEQLKAFTADKVKLLETKFQQSMDYYYGLLRTIIDQLEQQLKSLGDALVTETRENNRSIEEARRGIGNVKRQFDNNQESVRRQERKIESIEHTLNVTLADLEEYVRQQEFSSYDGQLLWKISDYERRRNDAVTGQRVTIYSPCFYTSRDGYKMCAGVCLNGRGVVRGTFMSVFCVVMRGEYDALLRWPFRQRVTFMLLDQDNMNHVISAFSPKPNSPSFQRPENETNITFGYEKFCSLVELNNHAYVKDNSMFLKIIVESD